jgi:hypothetical protein
VDYAAGRRATTAPLVPWVPVTAKTVPLASATPPNAGLTAGSDDPPAGSARGIRARGTPVPAHVRRLIAERRIPYLKEGRLIRFDPDEIADLAQLCPQEAGITGTGDSGRAGHPVKRR